MITASLKTINFLRFLPQSIKKTARTVAIIFFSILSAANMSYADYEDIPITTDNRIKTYIYNPNEVYLLVLHFGYQSHIEFAKGEEIQTISLGDSYAWKITPLANRLFIKPLEKNMRTNMTIITNKRTYQFDIVSQELEMGEEKDLVYVIRFYYPKRKSG
jgi:type IV secretion system protein VirB9